MTKRDSKAINMKIIIDSNEKNLKGNKSYNSEEKEHQYEKRS